MDLGFKNILHRAPAVPAGSNKFVLPSDFMAMR